MALARIVLDGGVRLSALLAEPVDRPARATVLALHGAGMSAGYFDGRAAPGVSFCSLAVERGYRVVAVDRPGYGGSAVGVPLGQPLAEQAATVRRALRDLGARVDTGAGVLLLGHSFGGKVALAVAAAEPGLLGADIGGCGHRYAENAAALDGSARMTRRGWGPLRLYPPGTFQASESIVGPVPALELREAHRWPAMFDALTARIRIPLRFTFGTHECWWRHDPAALAELRTRAARSPLVLTGHQPDAGHNLSLGHSAADYHRRVLDFLETCVDRKTANAS
ncbi:alpha/beta hydrolase family protein [Actinokineospora sp. G85]|uniref:alpha/beta hydrolase family protein n=1 Tax=Actinokineospora sp. G85 TaxID=3406626 RepID=UPI003C749CE5